MVSEPLALADRSIYMVTQEDYDACAHKGVFRAATPEAAFWRAFENEVRFRTSMWGPQYDAVLTATIVDEPYSKFAVLQEWTPPLDGEGEDYIDTESWFVELITVEEV